MKLDVRSEKLDKEIGSLSLDNPTSNLQSQDPSSNIQHPTSIIESSPIKDAGWVKVINLQVGDKIAVAGLSSGGLSAKGNINQKESNNYESKSNYSQGVNFSKIHDRSFLNLYANNNAIIPTSISSVNTVHLDEGSIPGKIGLTTATPNQNTEKLISQSAVTESNTVSNLSINPNSTISESAYQWDEIVSINYLGYEHVYDLQIENTHNFLANNIVAHNTYINGSTGLGAAFVNATTPSNGLAIQGNVGIGTTSPSQLFQINSPLTLGGSELVFTSSGRLGVGTTSPVGALHVVGQCVTGDSQLITEDGKNIRVDEVKQGQKVYTLNQENLSGQLVTIRI